MGLWSSGLPSALRSEATSARGMSPRKQVTSVQRLGGLAQVESLGDGEKKLKLTVVHDMS